MGAQLLSGPPVPQTDKSVVPLWARTVFCAAVNSILEPLAHASVPAWG